MRHSLLAIVLLVATGAAQSITITDANASFTWSPNPQLGAASADMTACCGRDNLRSWHWVYSVVGVRPSGLPIDDSGHGAYAQSVGSSSAQQTITDLDSMGLLDAVIRDTVVSSGPESGHVVHTLSLRNRTAVPISIRVYAFWNVQLNDTWGDDFSERGTGDDRLVVGDTWPGERFFECWGEAPDHWEVGGAGISGLEQTITLGGELRDRDRQSYGQDWIGALQWDVTLSPSGTESLLAVSGHDDARANTPGSTTFSGVALAGAFGAPTLMAPRAVLGPRMQITVNYGGPVTAATVLCGVAGSPITLPNCAGLTLGIPTLLTSASVRLWNGSGVIWLLEVRDPALAGVPFSWQAFVVDQTSPACLPLVHSNVMTTIFGD